MASVTSFAVRICHAGAAITTRCCGALPSTVDAAIRSREALGAGAEVSRFSDGTCPAIGTGIGGTEVDPDLAETSTPAWFAIALVVIEQLHTVCSARASTWLGKALVDVTLASLAGESWRAEALKGTNSVHTLAAIEAGVLSAIVHIHLTEFSLCAGRAGAGEVANQIITSAAIPAGLARAIIDIVLTLDTLEASGTGAAIGSAVVQARGSIKTRIGGTSVWGILAIRA